MPKKTYSKINLKPYYVFGLTLLQLMFLILIISLGISLCYKFI